MSQLKVGAAGGQEYLTKPRQYELVYSKGSSWVCRLVVMRTLPNTLTFSRYGFSVGKRVGKAVIRNRVKRRLREILRIMPLKWDGILYLLLVRRQLLPIMLILRARLRVCYPGLTYWRLLKDAVLQ